MNAIQRDAANRALLIKLVLVVLLMFGFAWALIPLYQVVCQLTGISAMKRDAGLAAQAALPVEMRFDATVQPGLPWQVAPLTSRLAVKPGQFVTVEYLITNASQRQVVGQAVPRYLPAAAAGYIKKIDCFCFRRQAFAPGETRRLPVVFVIDRAIPPEMRSITLAYSLYDVGS
ncbi:MAG: cytochrome c oxidase assembly protein [Paludibacterium sp.]|uniref:cytochrome c oxidase assembly protein n=1 Tax=Paludibacterium sp. TaxID=1917523 RepID=UPI0025F2AF27|nr:cytochrome c oxidase assembly protein [Paludibacterium sp.]MBV8045806.1 cytochrome c oxidase assembly protein [Paludibacterium sp.]MBV8647077.1 cytochrome c oxidase assembly protein [Paludibacterium sp.]